MIGRILGRKGILGDREQELRARESELLDRLSAALERFGGDIAADDLRRFRQAREQLAGLFLLVIAGEFNSGKSSFINALLGEKVLPEGVTPTTDRVNVLRWGPEAGEQLREAYLLDRTHPAELLRELNVVDTPGTNAIIREHEQLTRDFVPRSDLVLFVTSADRPFTESERTFLEQIREWGKKVVMIVNKIDILQDQGEREQVIDYVRDNAAALLGETPETFPVSAREAMAARQDGADPVLWERSGFGEMENYLLNTLDQEERVRLKLLNPLNVGLRLSRVYKEEAFERLKLLTEDVETIQSIDAALAAFHEEMLRDFEPRLNRLEVLLGEMEARGMGFFDEHIRIGRIRSLMDSETIRRAFEKEVIADTPAKLEEEVGRIIDWIVERNLKVWEQINQFIDRRDIARRHEGMIGEIDRGFNYNRQALLGSVGRVARDIVGGYDREREARLIANEVQGTFATTALAEVGAIGLGTLVATVLTGAAVDITGILLATGLAVGGFYIIPRKRATAKRDFRARVDEIRAQLQGSLTRQVHAELEESTERINQAIAPYRRFVRTQQEQLNEARGELVATEDALLRLRAEIEAR
ncbi:MAG: dynamin family protein [Longimicrobiaceae bacterium]|jgi:small GTP-binding protein